MAEPRIPGFAESHAGVKGRRIFVRTHGNGSAVLLLHVFPETGVMWHEIAPRLAAQFSVVVADLPGYAGSDCPAETHDHSAMSKRAMAEF